jgi:hypothetical protein
METNHPQPKSMRERILEKIDTRELSMRPKIYFTLKVAALVLITLAVLVISIFIFNFILFSSRINGHESLLGFGPRGILTFLEFFPWWLLGIDIALIILLEWLLRQFRFGYKSPVLYLLLTLLVVTASTAFLIDRGTAFNDQLRFINKAVITEEVEHFVPEHQFTDFAIDEELKRAVVAKGYVHPNADPGSRYSACA